MNGRDFQLLSKENTVVLANNTTKTRLKLKGHRSRVLDCFFSEDKRAFTLSADKCIVWDKDTIVDILPPDANIGLHADEVQQNEQFNRACITRDGKFLALSTNFAHIYLCSLARVNQGGRAWDDDLTTTPKSSMTLPVIKQVFERAYSMSAP